MLRNLGPPVPLSGSGQYGFSSLAVSGLGDDREAYMKAFGTVGTVWQIVHLLASNTAKPAWKLYRTSQDGRVRYTTSDQGSDQRTEVVKHQALTVLYNPNPYYSRFGLMEASEQYLELTGESWWVIERDPRANFPTGIWPVRPDRMEPVPDPDTYLKGYVYTAPDGREKVPLAVDDVVFVKFQNPLNPYRGLGPVQSVLVEVDAARSAGEWNRNFFLNSARPDGVIQVDHAMDDDEWDQLTERWREAHKGVGRAHRVAVLEAGATWVPLENTIKDMDFPNLRNVSRDLIREAWGIHKIMLGNSDDVNRANAQTGEEVFSNWSIAPRLDRWRDALNTQFLPLFGTTGDNVEFDYVYPTPTNREQDNAELTAKSAAALTLVQAGFDPQAVLEAVGLPDMPVAERATQAPALPPGWVPGTPPGQPAPAGAGEQAAESAGGGDAVNLLRRVLNDGYVPIDSGRR
jgi:HK97 family phage portal protein